MTALRKMSRTRCVLTFPASEGSFAHSAEPKQVAFSVSSLTSLNSYGYSPYPLETYLSWIESIYSSQPSTKPFIISITSSDPTVLQSMVQAIQRFRAKLNDTTSAPSMIAIELNTSCPNIPNSPPSAYRFPSLIPLLKILKDEYINDETLTIGLKLPPFVYRDQFREVLDGIKSLCIITNNGLTKKCPLSFLTCTNTLGTNLLFAEQADLRDPQPGHFAVPTALGGLAGESLHGLSLGNVYTFSQLLREHEYEDLKDITIIGVGGVTSKEAAARMRRAGAAVVGCATLFGKEGVKAFEIVTS